MVFWLENHENHWQIIDRILVNNTRILSIDCQSFARHWHMVPDRISSNILLCFEDSGRPMGSGGLGVYVYSLALASGLGRWDLWGALAPCPWSLSRGPLPLVQWAGGPANGPEPLSLASKGLLAFVGPPLRTCEAANLRPEGPKSKFGLICWGAWPQNRSHAQKWPQI